MENHPSIHERVKKLDEWLTEYPPPNEAELDAIAGEINAVAEGYKNKAAAK